MIHRLFTFADQKTDEETGNEDISGMDSGALQVVLCIY
jgi:hypothetical protein